MKKANLLFKMRVFQRVRFVFLFEHHTGLNVYISEITGIIIGRLRVLSKSSLLT